MALQKEAQQLVDQSKYSEAIPKFKEAIDVLPFVLSYKDYDDFISTNSNRSKEEKINTLSEIQGINNTKHRISYALSFAYRDGKDLQNNYQKAIDAVKEAIDQLNQAKIAQNIEKQVDPDNKLIGFFDEIDNQTLAGYYTQLGDLYRLYGANDLAVEASKKAVETDPKSADAFAWYGVALIANSQVSLGCQQLTTALKLDSSNADASKFKKQLCY